MPRPRGPYSLAGQSCDAHKWRRICFAGDFAGHSYAKPVNPSLRVRGHCNWLCSHRNVRISPESSRAVHHAVLLWVCFPGNSTLGVFFFGICCATANALSPQLRDRGLHNRHPLITAGSIYLINQHYMQKHIIMESLSKYLWLRKWRKKGVARIIN